MPRNKDIKKVLVIGSGPIVIGQAAEFLSEFEQTFSLLEFTLAESTLTHFKLGINL